MCLVAPLCQMNSVRRTLTFPLLEPLHGQPGELLPEGESLLDGKQPDERQEVGHSLPEPTVRYGQGERIYRCF